MTSRSARLQHRRKTFRCMAGREPTFCTAFINATIGPDRSEGIAGCIKRIEIGRSSISVTIIGRIVETRGVHGTGISYEVTREGTQAEFDEYFSEKFAIIENIVRDLEASFRADR